MNYILFFIAYLYFLYNDFRKKEISTVALIIYAVLALLSVAINKNVMTMEKFIDMIFSVAFGLIIYMLSYFSEEGIGIADGMFFVINGFILTLKENIILFFTGLFVAFIIGVIMIICKKTNNKKDLRLPFMPCFLPAIIGYIICIV